MVSKQIIYPKCRTIMKQRQKMSRRLFENIEELTGMTPMVHLSGFEKEKSAKGKIIGKLEFLNPAGSIKDRVAIAMIKDAEEKKLLTESSVIIEPTSGNTGIGLAAFAAAKGYRVILTMPDSMSIERRRLLAAYGAELILTEGRLGMKGAIKKAAELLHEIPGSFIAGQFTNEANPRAHYLTTGPEIWKDTEGEIDILVAGIGTGGTISGAGKYLKERNPKIRIVGVEPEASAVLSKGYAGPHKIQGIGAGFIPNTLNTLIYDEIITVRDEDAIETLKQLAKSDGILAGISSGAALYAAAKIAGRNTSRRKNIVVILPDGGSRYLGGLYGE